MTDTRMVRLEQIAAGPRTVARAVERWALIYGQPDRFIIVKCRQIADAAGGDVYEPADALEASLVEGLRRAKWPHLVQVEVVNG